MKITEAEHQDFIKNRIAEIQAEQNDYLEKRQAELDEFMRKTGMTAFIQETNIQAAKFAGRVEALTALLPEDPKEVPTSETENENIQTPEG